MRYLLILAVLLSIGLVQADSNPPSPTPTKSIAKPKADTTQYENNAEPDKRGTKEFPAIIEISKSPVIQVEATDKTEKRRDYSSNEWWMVYITGALVLITLPLAIYTGRLYHATVDSGQTQSTKMQASVNEAIRAANAMEDVATATKNNAVLMQSILQKQMRAYIAVDIGVPTCQSGNLKFAAAPVMTNTGFTPAKNVSHKIKSAILDMSLMNNFQFDESAQMINNDAALSPRQQFVLNSIVDSKVPDNDVPEIMQGNTRRLFVWGTVIYNDIFGNSWETNFCHNFIFFKEQNREGIEIIKFLGYYNHTHNSAT